MGAALNTAGAMSAYVLSDRGTWISFKNKGDLEIAVEGDKRLFNQYGIILVNPAKHPSVKKDLGQAFIDWVVSARRAERHPRLQDRRPAVVLPQCRPGELKAFALGCEGAAFSLARADLRCRRHVQHLP